MNFFRDFFRNIFGGQKRWKMPYLTNTVALGDKGFSYSPMLVDMHRALMEQEIREKGRHKFRPLGDVQAPAFNEIPPAKDRRGKFLYSRDARVLVYNPDGNLRVGYYDPEPNTIVGAEGSGLLVGKDPMLAEHELEHYCLVKYHDPPIYGHVKWGFDESWNWSGGSGW